MSQPGIKKFVLRTLVALLPVFGLIAIYVCMDPFGVVHHYDGISIQPGDTIEQMPNKRYVALEGFKYYHPQRHYDSFIFGSSISSNFTAAAWKRHLPDSASVYHFTEGAQTLSGIRDELRYLLDHGVEVRHVLLVMEEEMFHRSERYEEMPFVPHPDVSPRISWLHFHRVHFNALRDPDLLRFKLWPTREITDKLLADAKISTVPSGRDEMLNEDSSKGLDTLILNHPADYYADMQWLADMQPNPGPMPLSIDPKAEALLKEIAAMLREAHAEYQVIVPPRFRSQGLSAVDHALLCEIMGQNHVNDFSWDPELIGDLHSYYDGVHILTYRCTQLIDRAYQSVPQAFPANARDLIRK